MPEFDWYQASIPRPVEDILDALSDLSAGLAIGHFSSAPYGYAGTATLGNDRDGKVAQIWYGGTHEHPNATVSGAWAQPGAEIIRTAFPVHRVSRLDVKQDFGGADAYDRMQAQLVEVAARCRVKVGCNGDHLLTKEGRTCYLGSSKSGVRARLYDKAAEMRSKVGPPLNADPREWYRIMGVPEHLTRLEAEIRPHGEAKSAFATIEPVDALGCSKWMREVWKQVAQLDLTPVRVGKGYRPSDDERAMRYLLAQYGGLLRRTKTDLGSWECVGLTLGELLEASR